MPFFFKEVEKQTKRNEDFFFLRMDVFKTDFRTPLAHAGQVLQHRATA